MGWLWSAFPDFEYQVGFALIISIRRCQRNRKNAGSSRSANDGTISGVEGQTER